MTLNFGVRSIAQIWLIFCGIAVFSADIDTNAMLDNQARLIKNAGHSDLKLVLGIGTNPTDLQYFPLPWIGFSMDNDNGHPHLTGKFDDVHFLANAAEKLENTFELITVAEPLSIEKWTSSHLKSYAMMLKQNGAIQLDGASVQQLGDSFVEGAFFVEALKYFSWIAIEKGDLDLPDGGFEVKIVVTFGKGEPKMNSVIVIRDSGPVAVDPTTIIKLEQLFLTKVRSTVGNQSHETLVDPSHGLRQQTIMGNSKIQLTVSPGGYVGKTTVTIGKTNLPPNASAELIALTQQHQRQLMALHTIEPINPSVQSEIKFVSVKATRDQVIKFAQKSVRHDKKNKERKSSNKKPKDAKISSQKTKKEKCKNSTETKTSIEKQLLNNPRIVLVQAADSAHQYTIRQENGAYTIVESQDIYGFSNENSKVCECIKGDVKKSQEAGGGMGEWNPYWTKAESDEFLNAPLHTLITTVDDSIIKIYNHGEKMRPTAQAKTMLLEDPQIEIIQSAKSIHRYSMKIVGNEHIIVENRDIFEFSVNNGQRKERIIGEIKDCSESGGGFDNIDFATMSMETISALRNEPLHTKIITVDGSIVKIYY